MGENKLLLPVSIIVAGALIGGALYFSNKNGGTPTPQNPGQVAGDFTKLDPVGPEDHIFGNPQAKIKVIEYADPQCHFCKQFHPIMKQIMAEFAKGGEVAWVYRHFAILGPQSEVEAVATECAAELGGNEKFWQYLDLLFESKTDGGVFVAGKDLNSVAKDVGLDAEKFKTCMESGKHTDTIVSMRENAIAVGGHGTPYSLIVNSKGEVITPINGAQTFEGVKAALEKALAEN